MNLNRIFAVARKEWRELVRDRIYLSLALTLPIMMMFLFCWGMSQDVEHVKVAILDLDKSATSRDYIEHFTNGKYLTQVATLSSSRDIDRTLEGGKVMAVMVIPNHFEERLKRGMPTQVQTILNGTITLSIRTIKGYIDAINGAASSALVSRYLTQSLRLSPNEASRMMQPLTVQVRYLYNEEIKSIWMIAPDLVLVIIMWAMPVLMSLSIVREKETGSIFNINSSTVTRLEFLIGKIIPVAAICIANGFVLWAIAVFWFHAPFRGNPILFGIALVFYVIGAIGVGMLASVFLQTQQAALLVVIILGAIVGTRYSGMFIPLADMDSTSQFIAHLFPAAYFNTVVECSFLKGSQWHEYATEFMALIFYPFAIVGIGTLLFRKVSRA